MITDFKYDILSLYFFNSWYSDFSSVSSFIFRNFWNLIHSSSFFFSSSSLYSFIDSIHSACLAFALSPQNALLISLNFVWFISSNNNLFPVQIIGSLSKYSIKSKKKLIQRIENYLRSKLKDINIHQYYLKSWIILVMKNTFGRL